MCNQLNEDAQISTTFRSSASKSHRKQQNNMSDNNNNDNNNTATTSNDADQEETLFNEIGDDVEHENLPTVIESLCMNCEQNGTTRLLFTKIPHFKEVIVMSFDCEHCGYKSQEVQFGGAYAEKGVNIQYLVETANDLDRQLVKADSATISIPQLEFEIPAGTQKGSLNTLEGILVRSIDGLLDQQPVRKISDPENAEKIEQFVDKLRKTCLEFQNGPFTIVVDDPAGNSNIENPFAPNPDPNMKISHYTRTKEQNMAIGLGLVEDDVLNPDHINSVPQRSQEAQSNSLISSQEEAERFEQKLAIHVTDERDIYIFHENCFNCGKSGECKMVETEIPHFKKIILMAFACEHCGFRSNEVKAGGAISDQGTKITLKILNEEDMSRDLLKSETASVDIPEIDLHISEGSMGGKFTTIEGLLEALRSQLRDMAQFQLGDSSLNIDRQKHKEFLGKLEELETGTVPFTLIVDDPVSNSYVQNLYAPDPDPNLTIEHYTRNWEQDEELGLHQMNVD
jgi:zinc finger protein